MRLQAISDRPLVLALLRALERSQPALRVETRSSTSSELGVPAAPDGVSAVLVDMSMSVDEIAAFCERARCHSPHLPVLGLVCCPSALPPMRLRHLLAIGVTGVVDLRVTQEELLSTLRGLVRGASVVNLTDAGRRRSLRESIFGLHRHELEALDDAEGRLLELVAAGLPDRVIARHLVVSPHTVRHRVDRLRERIGVRNRIELAAWAGSRGLYAAADHPAR